MPGRPRPDSGALAELRGHSWPGNVRELRNVLRRAALMSPEGVLTAAALREAILADPIVSGLRSPPAERWTRSRQIETLGVPRSTFYYRLKRGRIPLATG